MAETKIEWADFSWNPVTGCEPVSAGCQHCYAARMAKRLAGRNGYPANDPFQVTFQEDRLREPLQWKKPRRVFVCSMGDLFHEAVWNKSSSFDALDQVFATMALCPQHTFMILTKRPERMAAYTNNDEVDVEHRLGSAAGCLLDGTWIHGAGKRFRRQIEHLIDVSLGECALETLQWPLANVWLGTSVENQAAANERIPWLLKCPAAVRFLSLEPLLGPIHLEPCLSRTFESTEDYSALEGVDWVIVGPETGPRRRPCDPEWIRSTIDQCAAAGVPVFVKAMEINGEIVKDRERFPGWANLQEFPAACSTAGSGTSFRR